LKSGSFTLLETSGVLQSCNEIAFYHQWHIILANDYVFQQNISFPYQRLA